MCKRWNIQIDVGQYPSRCSAAVHSRVCIARSPQSCHFAKVINALWQSCHMRSTTVSRSTTAQPPLPPSTAVALMQIQLAIHSRALCRSRWPARANWLLTLTNLFARAYVCVSVYNKWQMKNGNSENAPMIENAIRLEIDFEFFIMTKAKMVSRWLRHYTACCSKWTLTVYSVRQWVEMNLLAWNGINVWL